MSDPGDDDARRRGVAGWTGPPVLLVLLLSLGLLAGGAVAVRELAADDAPAPRTADASTAPDGPPASAPPSCRPSSTAQADPAPPPSPPSQGAGDLPTGSGGPTSPTNTADGPTAATTVTDGPASPPAGPADEPTPDPGDPGDPGDGSSPPAAPPTLGVAHGSLLGVAHTVIVQVRGLGAGGVVTLDATTPAPVIGLAPGCGLVRLGTVSCAVRADTARLTLRVLPPPGRGTSVVVRVTRAADGAGRSASLVLTP